MKTGKVKWFNSAKGYGFITPDDGGDDCFVHVTAIQASGLKQLVEEQLVEFNMQEGRNGRMVACDIAVLGENTEAAE
ncbi:MAG: cold-shock protein [Parvibaculales bacterium]